MSKYLPVGEFTWETDLAKFNYSYIQELRLTDDYGYMFEISLDYPERHHDKHNDFPLAPENMSVPNEWFSSYQQDLIGTTRVDTSVDKLVATLDTKRKYVVHYRTLQKYLKLGLWIKEVHRVLRFRQKPWIKSYIDKNTKLRKKAKNDFEKDFFKLMNNSVIGKTMENVRYRIDGHLLRDVQDSDKYRKLTYKPNYKSTVPFEDCELSFVKMYRTKTKLNKPIYCGVSILDISKTLMYDFYYNELKTTFGEKVNLLYTDTDSLLVQIEQSSDDLTGYLNEKRNLFDFSNYPPNHPLYSVKNKKVISKMKDEFGGKTILEAVCIGQKMYSILTTDQKRAL